MQFVRPSPAQKVDGDNGPSSLGRRKHLPASSGVPPIAAADMVFLSVNTPTKARGIGAGQDHLIVVKRSTLPAWAGSGFRL